MLVRNSIVNYTELIIDITSPYVLWVKFNEEAFGVSCIIGSVYLPCETGKNKDQEVFDTIYNDIFHLKTIFDLPLCLIGDMNSRTGNLNDILTFEHEIINSSEINDFAQDFFELNSLEGNNKISKKRTNMDKTINRNGEALIKLCKENNVIIVNGRTGSDREIGDITFKSKKGKSTIDYCLASPDFFSHIQDFQVDILDKNLSDKHSPIILTLETKTRSNINLNETPHVSDIEYEPISSKWDDKKQPDFKLNFDQNKINDLFQILQTMETNVADQSEINNLVKDISNISVKAGINANISKTITNNPGNRNNEKTNKPWFDHECRDKRRHFLQVKRRHIRRKCKTESEIENFNKEAKIYKNFIKMKLNQYKGHKEGKEWLDQCHS